MYRGEQNFIKTNFWNLANFIVKSHLPTSFKRRDPAVRSMGLEKSSRKLRFFGLFCLASVQWQDFIYSSIFCGLEFLTRISSKESVIFQEEALSWISHLRGLKNFCWWVLLAYLVVSTIVEKGIKGVVVGFYQLPVKIVIRSKLSFIEQGNVSNKGQSPEISFDFFPGF